MNLIVAVDSKNGIGRNNDLLVSLPEDLRNFRKITSGKTVIMGRKTYESLPRKPLPNRENIVISRTVDNLEGVVVLNSADEVYDYIKDKHTDDVFIIGGGQIYAHFIDKCKFAYITRIDADFDADTFFPTLSSNWIEISQSEPITDGGHTFRYYLYENTAI